MGGSVIAKATGKLYDLSDYNAKKYFKARNGGAGGGQNCSGANAEPLVLKVPLGTIIEDCESHEILADLVYEGQEVTLIQGGMGGKGIGILPLRPTAPPGWLNPVFRARKNG